MTSAEILIRNILGPTPNSVKPLACAVQLTVEIMFIKRVEQEDIHMTNDIYEQVGVILRKNGKTMARQIERQANYCWNFMTDEQKRKYIGRDLKDIQAPRDMIFYLAYYLQYGKSYYELMENLMDRTD